MKTVATQFGISFNADFEENLWAFLMKDKYTVRAGTFAIVDKPVYDSMLQALQDSLQMLEQTKQYRKANDITAGNVFLDTTIDTVKAAILKANEDEK